MELTPPLPYITPRLAQVRLIYTVVMCEGRCNRKVTGWLWQLAAFQPVSLHVPSAATCAGPFDLDALVPAMSLTSVPPSGISCNILQLLVIDDISHTPCARPITLHMIQQFARSVINNHLSLVILLRVSSSKGSSSGRYNQRHRNTADFSQSCACAELKHNIVKYNYVKMFKF